MENVIEQDIVIVGAGIAGLTTSLGLHRLGVPSLVLESWNSLRVSGFALTLWKNAWKALDVVGVGDTLRHQHLQLHGIVTNSLITGQQTSTISFKDNKGKYGAHEVRCVRRRLLLEALANELPNGTIRYLSKVIAIEESGFFKILHLSDGTTIKTKVNNMCDIYNMKLDNKELAQDPAELKQYVLSKLEMIPSDVRYFIEKTEVHEFQYSIPLRYRHPWELIMRNISKGNVCVAGDALHSMPPDLGEGGCCALEDGVVLARCLAEVFSKKPKKELDEYKMIEKNLKKYAKERRWRCIDLITTSYIVGAIMQSGSKSVNFIRDTILATFLTVLLVKKSDFDCGQLK